jgi:capsular polysaccharide biosynthesis protein
VVSRTRRGQLLGEAFAVITFAVLVIPWVISLYQTPTYEASIKILVGQRSIGEPSFELLTGDVSGVHASHLHLRDPTLTVANAADTLPVAQAVVEQLNLPEQSAGEVLQNIRAEPKPGTIFVDISYTSSDPTKAQLTANAIGQVLSEKASEVSVGTYAITATVWAPAKLPKTPVSPNPVRNMLLAGATWALMLGLLITARASLGNPRESYSAATEERISRVHGR